MKRICVFCGSSPDVPPEYLAAAADFGRRCAARGLGVVYGGGSTGLMGAVADAALAASGHVTGVIPRTLWRREVGHGGLSELHQVHSMHERKALMVELSDAFVALPGGIGTMDEMFEAWTWALLGVHGKPCGLLNVAGYFDSLLEFLEKMTALGFLGSAGRAMLLIECAPERLLDRLAAYSPPAVPRWLGRDET